MKLRVGLMLILTVLLSGCGLSQQKSGVEIITYPTAKVFINGKEAGTTPYKNNSLKPGEVEIRLIVNEVEWVKRIHLENGANTVINREFTNKSDINGGYILHFEATGDSHKAGLLIGTKPDRSTVAIDDEIKGYSPLRLQDVGAGDKKLVMSFPGHKSVSSYVKFIDGYQLVVEADLPAEEETITPVPTPTTVSDTTVVVIKTTETGWLRVRNSADASGLEISRVNTGEKYTLKEEQIGWYKIDLGDGRAGWISAKYADKLP